MKGLRPAFRADPSRELMKGFALASTLDPGDENPADSEADAARRDMDGLRGERRLLGATAEEIFASYFDVEKRVGRDEMKNIPFGAIAMYTMADKLACGLQQLMAGARKFRVDRITRNDIFAGNRETAQETGITHMTDARDESAKKILMA